MPHLTLHSIHLLAFELANGVRTKKRHHWAQVPLVSLSRDEDVFCFVWTRQADGYDGVWSLGACLAQVKTIFASPVLGTLIETSVLSSNMCWNIYRWSISCLEISKKEKALQYHGSRPRTLWSFYLEPATTIYSNLESLCMLNELIYLLYLVFDPVSMPRY
ncbi:hypothetical protein F5Y02DRAFT_191888 [Annulohypoxylon stygium]|nr:hypothetical protein F5Y02DRAFT_191888 [Annulohypoxylon stygium]